MKIKILVAGFKCERCGHEWMPRTKGEQPIVCPKCKSPYWDVPRKGTVTAKKAGVKRRKTVGLQVT